MTKTPSEFKTALEQRAENARKPVSVTAATVAADERLDVSVIDRQEQIAGFDQKTFSRTSVLLVGAGAVGGEIGEGLVRKGVGELHVCDEDVVDVSNLSRQKFHADDIGKNKAVTLAENLAQDGTRGTTITGYPWHFQDTVAQGYEFDVDIAVVAPDNDEARLAVAEYFLGEIPIVFTGLDQMANGGFVFAQEVDGPCFRCLRPDAGGGGSCGATPATIDPVKTIGGIALFAIDSVLMGRYREDWHCYEVFFSGVPQPNAVTIEHRPDCSLCNGTNVRGGSR